VIGNGPKPSAKDTVKVAKVQSRAGDGSTRVRQKFIITKHKYHDLIEKE